MRHHDETILRSRRVQPAAPFPVAHQAVRIAMYEAYAARSFHARVIEAFGARAPFDAVLREDERQIAALARACDRLGCARPLDPFPAETTPAPSWRANCERAVAGEAARIRLYDALLPYAGDAALARLFVEQQATARDRHLPAFQQAVADALALERYHAGHGIPPQQAHARHGAVADLLERLLAQWGPGAGPIGLVAPLVRNAHPALLAGLAAGAGGAYLLKRRTEPPPIHEED